MQVFRVASAALFAAVFFSVPLAAQPLAQISGPREEPPADYSANQYVDSMGCVFMRAGVGDAISWVPRVNRDRRLVCGYAPSLPGLARAAATPAPDPVVPDATAAPEPAAKPAPEPAVAATPATLAKAPEPAGIPAAASAAPAPAAVIAAKRAVRRAARLVQIRPVAGTQTYCPDPGPSAQRFLLSDGRRVTRCGAPVADAVAYLNGLRAPGLVVEPGRASARAQRQARAADAGDYRVVWNRGDLARRSTATTATTATTARPGTTSPAAPGSYYVQAGAFAVPANADATVARLKALGLPVATAADRKGARPVRIVFAGPFTRVADASDARARLRSAGYPDAFLR